MSLIDDRAEIRALREQVYDLTIELDHAHQSKSAVTGYLSWLMNLDPLVKLEEIQAQAVQMLSKWIKFCHYCNDIADTTDHVVPVSLGGRDKAYNRVPACLECNKKKADRPPTCMCDQCQVSLAIHLYYERVIGSTRLYDALVQKFSTHAA